MRRRDVIALASAALASACGGRQADHDEPVEMSAAATSAAEFPLRVHESGHYLVDATQAPFLIKGDAAWSLIAQLSREDVQLYLDDRAARGFNTLLVSLLEARFADNAPANVAGDAPFLTPGDYATPNEAYFAHAAWVIREARARGFLVLLCASYIGWIGGGEGWYDAMQANGLETLRGYGRYVAQRFADLDNIVWVNGGDDDPPNRDLVRAVAAGISEVMPNALQTAHCGWQTSALDYWPDEPWLALNTLYTDEAPRAAWRERTRPQRMPFFMIEATYEDENAGGRHADEALIRAVAYQTVLCGGCGHVFGANPIWNFGGPFITEPTKTWQEALNGRGTQSMMHLHNLFAAIDWSSLVPDDGSFLLGESERDYIRPAVAAVAADGRSALVYAPRAHALTLDIGRLAAMPRLRWFDPSNGAYTDIALSSGQDRTRVTLTPDRRNAAGFGDWVLVVTT
jgi:hypothetical protein